MPVRNIFIALALVVFALSVSFFGQSAEQTALTEHKVPPTTAQLEKVANPPTVASSSISNTTGTETKSVETSTIKPIASSSGNLKPVAPSPSPAVVTAPPQTLPPAPVGTLTRLDSTVGLLQSSLVNIICYSTDPSLSAISGTGVMIDSRGLILTAAHVAQYLLLANYPSAGGSSCIIRVGSPAETAYRAKLVYVSPKWIQNNATTLVQKVPVGTGENDFAILAVTENINNYPMPKYAPHVSLSNSVPNVNDSITIGSYGAEFLSSKQVRSALYPIIDFGTIKDRFTFVADTIDLIALGGGAAAQEGSSGGGVLNSDNELIGLITTDTESGSFSSRDLHAITPGHIRRSFASDMGVSLDTYLANHTLDELVANFKEKASFLSSIVIHAISSH